MKKYYVDDLFDYKLDGTEKVISSGMGKSLVQWEDDDGDYYLAQDVESAIKEAIEKIKEKSKTMEWCIDIHANTESAEGVTLQDVLDILEEL